MSINLTAENYYSPAINQAFMSVSQFKEFAGTPYKTPCEKCAFDNMMGWISVPPSTALLIGSYVDSYFEGTLDQFKQDHPEIFKKTGDKGLKAEYVNAEKIIARIERDPLFTEYMSGQKQVIMRGDLFGTTWKIKMDSYHDDKIVDLKIMRDANPIWSDVAHRKIDFIRYYGYDIQGAIYQRIVELNTGKKLPFYIAYATKEAECDIDIVEVTQPYLDEALKFVEDNIGHVLDIKMKRISPVPCGYCWHCRREKVLSGPRSIEDLIPPYDGHEDDGNPDVDASKIPSLSFDDLPDTPNPFN